jgi:hypothetical protein
MNHKKKPRRCRCLALDSCLDSSIHRFTNSLGCGAGAESQEADIKLPAGAGAAVKITICGSGSFLFIKDLKKFHRKKSWLKKFL